MSVISRNFKVGGQRLTSILLVAIMLAVFGLFPLVVYAYQTFTTGSPVVSSQEQSLTINLESPLGTSQYIETFKWHPKPDTIKKAYSRDQTISPTSLTQNSDGSGATIGFKFVAYDSKNKPASSYIATFPMNVTAPAGCHYVGYTADAPSNRLKITTSDGGLALAADARALQLMTSVSVPYEMYTNCSITLNFEANTYTVNYNANGGTGNTATSSHTYDVDKALTPNGFTRSGYKFTGWNTEPDGSGTSYSDGQTVKNLTTEHGETINLYAQWDVKAKSDTATITGIEFDRVTSNNRVLTLNKSLKTGQWFGIFGLNKDATYNVAEAGTENYEPSYKVSEGADSVYKPKDKGEEGESLSSQ